MEEYGDQSQRSGMGDGASTPIDSSAVLAELVDEAVIRLDSDGVVITANSRFGILIGKTDSEIIGSHISSFVVEADDDRLAAVVRALRTQDHGHQTTVGVSLWTDWEEAVACQLSLAVVSGTDDSRPEIIGTVRPVDTAEAELQRRTRQQEAVASLSQQALESDDLDALMYEAAQLVSETLDATYSKVLDLDSEREELLLRQGVGWQEGIVGNATVDSNTNSQAGYTLLSEDPVIVDDLDTEPRFTGPELLTAHDVTSGISVVIGSFDEPWGILGVHDTRHRLFTNDDVNFVQSVANVLASAIDRHGRTQELQQYERIIETVNDGVYVVDSTGQFTMVNDAYCELTGYDREELLGADTSLLADEEVRSEVSAVEGEMAAETVESPTMEAELTTADGDSITAEATFARLQSDDGWKRVGVVRDISERKAYEQRLERQQKELTALNEVNTVVREITDAILEQSTRAEIEQLVCESLVETDSYVFSVIAEVDARCDEIHPQASAGITGSLHPSSITTDPDDPATQGPASRAIETHSVQVSHDLFTDSTFESWWETAETGSYQSAAAIPITHEGTLYGVLGIAAEAVDAFTEEKQAIIEQLGEIIGHAIAAAERKQALMSDTVTELEFEIRDFFSVVGGPDSPDGKLIVDRTIPTADDCYLLYGRATTEMIKTIETLSTQLQRWESFTVFEERETMTAFELRLSEPPITSVVADAGGSVREAVIEDGDLRAKVHLPQTTSVRTVLDRIRETYPTAHPTARRQVSRSEITTQQAKSAWMTELTDKQRASLEAAYFSGFFEWPRNSSGTEIADSMDVSPATFSQHLRATERKLFSVLFEEL